MAINIDGLTAAGALDPNDIFEVQQAGVNKKLELGELWVIAKGINTLELYKSATATTIIRPGIIHINDGTDDYVRESITFATVTISGATGWSFITCTEALAFTQRADSGGAALTARPSATCYSYVAGADTGYSHTKSGYYYDADERIIGAVYWNGSAILYTINNLSNTYEVGENSLGKWSRSGKEQIIKSPTVSRSSADVVTFPVPFLAGTLPVIHHEFNTTDSLNAAYVIGSVSMSNTAYALRMYESTTAAAQSNKSVGYTAYGDWRL